MSAEQTPDIETLILRVLEDHVLWETKGRNLGAYRTEWICDCGHAFVVDQHRGQTRASEHRAHVAQALAPVLAAAVREALVEAADEAEALQTFAHGNNPVSRAHVIGFGTARRLIVRQLRDRAGRVAEPQHEAATSGKESEEE